MKLIAYLFKNSRGAVMLAILAGSVSGIGSTILLGLITRTLGNLQTISTFHVRAFIGLCVFVPVTRFVSELLLNRLGQGAVFDLRIKLSRRVLAAPLRQLEKIGAHKLMAALTDDVVAIAQALFAFPLTCINLAVVLGCLVYLGWLSFSLLFLVLGFMVIGIISYQLPLMKAVRSLHQARDAEDSLFKDFRAMTDGSKELKLHRRRREAFLKDSLEPSAATFRDRIIAGQAIYSAAASWGQILFFVLIGVLLFLLPSFTGGSVSTLTGYVIVLLYLMAPLQMALNSLPALGRANVALRKINELGLSLDEQPEEFCSSDDELPATAWRRLELVNVTHSYGKGGEEDDFVLGPIDLAIDAGQLIFLIGGNGSGKTTLAKILLGLYVPDTGSIRIGEQLVTDQNRDAYRQHFSALHSDFYLFERLLGLETSQLDAAARAYLIQFQLDEKVQVKDGVLSTIDLSRGQRKRLALLTAYLEDRPFYVFDEWAADQDPVFKQIFYHQILPELKARGKTVLVISHDDAFYNVADRVFKLDYGKIVYDESVPYSPTASAKTVSARSESSV
jgi:putative pyoverdin transport system ATP-binding/permease protein